MIRILGGQKPIFVLETESMSYVFRVRESGHLEHIYYGRHIHIEEERELESLLPKRAFAPGNTILYDNAKGDFSLETMAGEVSSWGKGDPREAMLALRDVRGNRTTDWIYECYQLHEAKSEPEGMPGAHDASQELVISLSDKLSGHRLELFYALFEDCHAITRRSRLQNGSKEPIFLEKFMSYSLDLGRNDLSVQAFHGAWTREMQSFRQPISGGKWSMASRTGSSSNRANPFFMLLSEGCGEERGEAYAFNLIYSGNHYAAAECSFGGSIRVMAGINPEDFAWKLESGASFDSPEALLSYSDQGIGQLTLQMHDFVREHILRGFWAKRERPILLNSWEANYFDISEKKLLSLGKAAKELGMELLVVDDGWFQGRNDDHAALGDWRADQRKLPHGLAALSAQIHAMGLQFGLWVEPEMVNVNSEFYREHPDWVMQLPWDRESHAEGRFQRILDLANPHVVDEMIARMKELFSSAQIDYVKWDMNRIFSDVYSPYLPAEQQQETGHRYILGLYRMMRELSESFPRILFEGCASGGNRFDLGILSYFPQIWASDNTDPVSRMRIQEGYSYGYPQVCFSSHISASPNHQTLRQSSLETRFDVAAFGNLGYELNVLELSKEEREEIKAQVEIYKQYRQCLQFGHFYRKRKDNEIDWTIVSPDQRLALGFYARLLQQAAEDNSYFYPRGLKEDLRYHFYNQPRPVDLRVMGSLINQALPVHIKDGGLVWQALAHFKKLEGEKEDYQAFGDSLMAGVRCQQNFVGTGFNEHTRYLPDFATRIYFMEVLD